MEYKSYKCHIISKSTRDAIVWIESRERERKRNVFCLHLIQSEYYIIANIQFGIKCDVQTVFFLSLSLFLSFFYHSFTVWSI